MKILLLAGYAESLVIFRGPLIQQLVGAGHEVFACAPDISRHIEDSLTKIGANVRRIPMQRTGLNAFADVKFAMAVRRLAREIRPDRILAYTMKPVIYGGLAAGKEFHCVSLITGLGYAFASDSPRQRLIGAIVRILLRFALRRARTVIFQNPDDRQEFIKRGIINDDTDSRVVNGSGVDIDYYAYSPVTSTHCFLMIARLLEDKGVREYAEAARLVRQEFPDAEFQLAGWLDENPRCIDKTELDGWVRDGTILFLGRLDDVRPAIAGCTAYVLPSYREGMPRTNLEAMSMGRAIITTDVPGCRETVEAGQNGLLVPARNAPELAAAIMSFLSGESSASEMGRYSRSLAERKYDVRKVNAQMFECLGL